MRILAGILAYMIMVLLGLVILIGELIKNKRKSK